LRKLIAESLVASFFGTQCIYTTCRIHGAKFQEVGFSLCLCVIWHHFVNTIRRVALPVLIACLCMLVIYLL